MPLLQHTNPVQILLAHSQLLALEHLLLIPIVDNGNVARVPQEIKELLDLHGPNLIMMEINHHLPTEVIKQVRKYISQQS